MPNILSQYSIATVYLAIRLWIWGSFSFSMSKSLHISHITLDSKSVPWSLYIALGTPKRQINFPTDLSATVEAPWLGVPSAWPAATLVPGPLAQFREEHGRFVCALLAHWEILHEFQYGKQFFLRRTLIVIPVFIHCSAGIRSRMLHTILYLTSSEAVWLIEQN